MREKRREMDIEQKTIDEREYEELLISLLAQASTSVNMNCITLLHETIIFRKFSNR